AARIVTGRIVDSRYLAIRKGGGVEGRRLKRVLVEPEADRVLWLHVLCAPCARSGRPLWSRPALVEISEGSSFEIRTVTRPFARSLENAGVSKPVAVPVVR